MNTHIEETSDHASQNKEKYLSDYPHGTKNPFVKDSKPNAVYIWRVVSSDSLSESTGFIGKPSTIRRTRQKNKSKKGGNKCPLFYRAKSV
jgi:hypothetical protein